MGKVRDFSAATIDNIKTNLVDESPDGFWDSVGDFFRGVFSFNKSLDSDLGNFDKYMDRICEINDITEAKFNQIIADVHIVENTYSNQFDADAYNILQVLSMMNILSSEVGKGDFEKAFDKNAVNNQLNGFQLKNPPMDFSGMSPELASKVISMLPVDEVPDALAQLSVDELCDLTLEEFDDDKSVIYYEEVANRIVITTPGTLDSTRLINAFYDSDYGRYLSANPGELNTVMTVVRNEIAMPTEDLDKINNFMSTLDVQDEVQIKFLGYTAAEPFRELFIRYLDQFSISSTTQSGVFNSGSNTLAFDVAADRTNARGVYYTFFHEIGHAIDYYYGQENGSSGFYSGSFVDSQGRTLSECNRIDVENSLSQSLSNLVITDPTFSQWSAQDQQRAMTAVLSNLMNYNLDFGTLTTDEQALQNALRAEYRTLLTGADNENASDVYGGITNNTIVSTYGHHGVEVDGSTYWLNADNSVRRTTEKESFAEYYGRYMVADPEKTAGLTSTGTYLPESVICIEEMLASMK